MATALNNLAALHRLTGNYARAEPLYLRALAINEKANGPDHPTVAVVLNNLGLMFQQQGNLEKARPLLERSLAIREKAAGPDHPDVARALNNLGSPVSGAGRHLTKAERLYQPRGADLREGVRPKPSVVRPDTEQPGRRFTWSRGEYAVAGPMYDEALAVRAAALGPTHPEMTIALTSQAIYLDVTGKIARRSNGRPSRRTSRSAISI